MLVHQIFNDGIEPRTTSFHERILQLVALTKQS